MHLISVYSRRALRNLIRLWLVALGAALVLSILFIGLIATLISIMWSLLTGRKPAAFTVFKQFRQTAQQFRPEYRADHGLRKDQKASEVVDVQAREVPHFLPDNNPPTNW